VRDLADALFLRCRRAYMFAASFLQERRMCRSRSMFAPLAAFVLAAGCGDPRRDVAPAGDGARAAGARSSAPAASAAGAPRGRTLLITGHDHAFTGVPERVPTGWLTVRMVNAGREMHMLGIGRVPAGHSAREVLGALLHGRPAPETQDWGGPNAASPGDTATVALFFPPGEYVLTCVVESADGERHLAKGMVAAFEVVPASDAAADSAAAPAGEDALVTLTDYRVDVRGALAPGPRTVRVRNAAAQGHDLQILELLPGRSAEDALRWFEHPGREAPTARAVGGVVAMHASQEALVTATLRPGTYLFLCWVPDATGRPHFRHGMWRTVTVPPTA
jgi:hypothetical protein